MSARTCVTCKKPEGIWHPHGGYENEYYCWSCWKNMGGSLPDFHYPKFPTGNIKVIDEEKDVICGTGPREEIRCDLNRK